MEDLVREEALSSSAITRLDGLVSETLIELSEGFEFFSCNCYAQSNLGAAGVAGRGRCCAIVSRSSCGHYQSKRWRGARGGAESGSAEERRKQIGNTSRVAARKRARENESHGESDQREPAVVEDTRRAACEWHSEAERRQEEANRKHKERPKLNEKKP